VGFVALSLRNDQQKREEEKLAKDQDAKKQKDFADGLAKQLEEVQKQNADLRRIVDGWPQPGVVPQGGGGGKNAVEVAQALAKAKTDAFLAKAHEVKIAIAKLEKEADSWGPRFKDVMVGDVGKQLASKKAHVEQIAVLVEKERLSADMARSLAKQLKTLLDPVEAAVKAENKFFAPDDSLVKTVEAIETNTQKRLREYESDRNLLESMIADSEKAPADAKTLKQAIQDLVADQDRKRLASIAAAKQAALDEVAKKIADAEVKGAYEIGEIKLKQTLEMTITEKQQMEIVLAKMKKDRERKLLEAKYEAALPDIKRYLAVFIANGFSQPDGERRLVLTSKSEPMSLNRLAAAGCLNENQKGLQNLLDIGSNFHNDRFKKNFPIQGVLMAKDLPYVQRAQELLREFGPLMVEKGLLTP